MTRCVRLDRGGAGFGMGSAIMAGIALPMQFGRGKRGQQGVVWLAEYLGNIVQPKEGQS